MFPAEPFSASVSLQYKYNIYENAIKVQCRSFLVHFWCISGTFFLFIMGMTVKKNRSVVF